MQENFHLEFGVEECWIEEGLALHVTWNQVVPCVWEMFVAHVMELEARIELMTELQYFIAALLAIAASTSKLC